MSIDERELRDRLHEALSAVPIRGAQLPRIRQAALRRRRLHIAATSIAAAGVVAAGAAVAVQAPWAADSARLQPTQTVPPEPVQSTPPSTPPTRPTPAETPASLSVAAARASWALMQSRHPATLHSDVIVIGGVAWGATARQADVTVYRYSSATAGWQSDGHGRTTDGAPASVLDIAHLTGISSPDVVVSTIGADAYWTSVLSRSATSRWSADTFDGCGGGSCAHQAQVREADGDIKNGAFTSMFNPCTPSCVESVPYTLTWRWDAATKRFVESSRAQAPAHLTVQVTRTSPTGARNISFRALVLGDVPQLYDAQTGKPIPASAMEVNGTRVDWGDGSSPGGSDGGAIACHPHAKLVPLTQTFTESHTYSRPGTYTVRFSTSACAPVGQVSRTITFIVH